MGSRFTGALAYAVDLTLLAPYKLALSILFSVCEKYASELDIIFNGSKSKLLIFNGMFSNGMESGVMVNGEMINMSYNVVHLRHIISSSDRESNSLTAKDSFRKSFKTSIYNFCHTYLYIKCSLLKQFCCSFMVHHYRI